MQAVVESGDLDHTVRESAQRHRQRRDVGAPVVRVRNDDDVGREQVAMRREQARQRRRTGLLFALDEHRHTDRRRPAVGAECGQMRCDACLVVGGAAPVQPPVALGRLERRRHPLRAVTFRLHIVVGVQQHRRRSRRRGMAGDDRRCASLSDDPHIVEPGLRQQLRHRLGAALHFRAAGRVSPHGFDAHQRLEVGTYRRQYVAHPGHQITHGVHASCSRSPRPRAGAHD